MDDKIICVLAGFDENTQAHLANMQTNLYDYGFVGTHTKDLICHITLGTFGPDRESEIVKAVDTAAQNFKSFDITFNHVGIFGGSKVLFVAPDPNCQLLKLKEVFGSSFNWTPHTTMLIDKPQTIYKALPILSDNFASFQGKVTQLDVFEFWPTRHIYSANLNS